MSIFQFATVKGDEWKSSVTSDYVLNYETFMAFGIYTKNGYLYLGNALAYEKKYSNSLRKNPKMRGFGKAIRYWS